MKKEIKNHWQTWVFLLTLGIILIVVYKAIDSIGPLVSGFRNFLSILSPFLVGLLMAYLLYIPERKIEELYRKSNKRLIKKYSRRLGIFTTYIIAILILIVIINFILPVLIQSVNELLGNLQLYYAKLIDGYNKLPEDSIFKTEQAYNALKELQNFDIKQYTSFEKITNYIKSAVGVARGVFDVFVALIVSIYILAERSEILVFFKKLSKALFKENAYRYLERCFFKANGIFFKFITSQFVDAVVVGVLTTIAMKIMGIKYASLLGFTIGLFNMIPYFGAIIAIGIAGIITLITTGFSKTIIMLIVIIILQQIDAYVINPKIVGDSLKISPLLVLLGVTIGGAYFGVIGMFLGVPVAGVLKILVNDYIDNKLSL